MIKRARGSQGTSKWEKAAETSCRTSKEERPRNVGGCEVASLQPAARSYKRSPGARCSCVRHKSHVC